MGVIGTAESTFVPMSAQVPGLNTLSIPVPSRLYTMDLPNARPLEGRRIGVKDLFDMAGLRTGGGSRAYYNTYPPKEVTATAIQRLIDQVCPITEHKDMKLTAGWYHCRQDQDKSICEW